MATTINPATRVENEIAIEILEYAKLLRQHRRFRRHATPKCREYRLQLGRRLLAHHDQLNHRRHFRAFLRQGRISRTTAYRLMAEARPVATPTIQATYAPPPDSPIGTLHPTPYTLSGELLKINFDPRQAHVVRSTLDVFTAAHLPPFNFVDRLTATLLKKAESTGRLSHLAPAVSPKRQKKALPPPDLSKLTAEEVEIVQLWHKFIGLRGDLRRSQREMTEYRRRLGILLLQFRQNWPDLAFHVWLTTFDIPRSTAYRLMAKAAAPPPPTPQPGFQWRGNTLLIRLDADQLIAIRRALAALNQPGRRKFDLADWLAHALSESVHTAARDRILSLWARPLDTFPSPTRRRPVPPPPYRAGLPTPYASHNGSAAAPPPQPGN